jgi:hypothetical protein
MTAIDEERGEAVHLGTATVGTNSYSCCMQPARMTDPMMASSGLMIPGERERNTLTRRQPGSMGGPASGSDVGGAPSVLMDAVTIAEHQREGGGAPSSRKGR